MGSSKGTSARPRTPLLVAGPYAYSRTRRPCADCDLGVGRQLHRHVRAVPAEVVRVRAAVLAALTSWGCPPGAVDDGELLVSELVTNAVVHTTDTTVTVNVVDLGNRLLIEVTDSSPVRPALRTVGPEDEQGRGMQLVEAVASAWGSRREPGRGKTTWCTLALDGGDAARRPR
ncbi:ATP-binding protein [Streptomyces sp. BH055]|uniref:ATP-binding protein n=1 Tax=unclassified Streptomyces TaxID=2593676 RepID=UPI003BB69DC0